MLWNDIVGHGDHIRRLQGLLTAERRPHAYLFVGVAGIGKYKVAQIFAAAILCLSDEKPCGVCRSCTRIMQETHPNCFVIRPDGLNIKIEQIRLLQQESGMTSYDGQLRVVILDDADDMTLEAANSLLKLLEEPPPGFILILVSAHRDKILPTIQSRCSIIAFQPLTYDAVADVLIAQGYEQPEARLLARLGGGSVGASLTLAAPEITGIRQQALAIMTEAAARKQDFWELSQGLEKLELADLLHVLRHMATMVRDCILLQSMSTHTEQWLLNRDVLDELKQVARLWTERQCVSAYRLMRDTEQTLLAKTNPRLACEALLIQLYNITT